MEWATLGAAGISGLANLFGGMTSAKGQAEANSQNINLQREQWNNQSTFQNNVNVKNWEQQDKWNQAGIDFAREQTLRGQQFAMDAANHQMDFQGRMASTAYQRGMADMKAAGLNPILAYKQGGADAPGGALAQNTPAGFSPGGSPSGTGTSSSAARVENTQSEIGRALGRAASSAVDTYRMGEDARLKAAQTKLTAGPQYDLVRKQEAGVSAQIDKTTTETDINRQEVENRKATLDYIKANTAKTLADAGLLGQMSGNMSKYGTREAPDTIERMLRQLQSYLSTTGPTMPAPPAWDNSPRMF